MDGTDKNLTPPNGEGEGEGAKKDGEAKTLEDLQIENNALKELLAENKKTIDKLNDTMAEVKTSNAKLLNQLDVGANRKSVDDIINEQFNKYFKKG